MLGHRFDDGGGEPDGVWSRTTEFPFFADDGGEGFAERKRLHREPRTGRSQFFAGIAVSGAALCRSDFGRSKSRKCAYIPRPADFRNRNPGENSAEKAKNLSFSYFCY